MPGTLQDAWHVSGAHFSTLCDAGQLEFYDAEAFQPIADRLVELTPAALPALMPGT